MFARTLLTLALLLSTAPAYACLMTADEKQALFTSYDTSSDGVLSLVEYSVGEKSRNDGLADDFLEGKFNALDSDTSGSLGLDEFEPIHKNRKCL